MDVGVSEADIANADPRCEFEEEQGQETVNAAVNTEGQVIANLIAGTDKPEDPVLVVDRSEEEERAKLILFLHFVKPVNLVACGRYFLQ